MNPKVSIVVTTYVPENKAYLDAAMDSIANLDYDNFETILVAKPSYMPTYANVKTVSPDKTQFYCTEGMNFGVRSTDPASKYLLLLNDDVILTRNSLAEFVRMCGDHEMILNPISPCDNYFKYGLFFGYERDGKLEELKERFYRMEFFGKSVSSLKNAHSIYPPGVLFQDFLCMFATFVPRKVWEKVGPLDDSFRGGPDDIDYSYRARNANVRLGVVLSSLIWHFGGVSADKTVDWPLRKWNAKHFYEKWGHPPPGVTMEFINSEHDNWNIS